MTMEDTDFTMEVTNPVVNAWLTEYLYENFWKCYTEKKEIDMKWKYFMDGIIDVRENDGILSATGLNIDLMLNVIKFVLYLLQCDPKEGNTDVKGIEIENHLWTVCQSLNDERVSNLVLTYLIICHVKREQYQLASTFAKKLQNLAVDMVNNIHICVNGKDPTHRLVREFEFEKFKNDIIAILYG